MADTRTEITEIMTGLGLFGFRDLERALAARPRFILNVDNEVYDRLDDAYVAGQHAAAFSTAYENGAVFARADDGLRGRPPWQVEWKGPHRPPAYEQIPADLRVDHVYLLSCKYGSNILHNASPWHVFDRALTERAKQSGDWFAEVAPESFQEFYAAVRSYVDDTALPERAADLEADHRLRLKAALKGQWPAALRSDWQLVAFEIARASAARLLSGASGRREREEFLWRVLRLQAAPYFVLGAGLDDEPLRYRVGTPWDFRNQYELRSFDMWGEHAGQPTVRWRADLHDRERGERVIEGHVEVRWSHGKFAGVPEAKIYLDTPHHDVAGYEPLAGSSGES
ncbi:MAG: hypothetical protein ACI9C1_002676 [Candidatus Aldehydirespiratoraceae bacterium]|jgi:hypothetical protein